MSEHVIYSATGKPVRRSRNLRGLITHAGHNAGSTVHVWPIAPDSREYQPGWASAYFVTFANGDFCSGTFASHALCVEFFTKRAPRWSARLFIAQS